QGDVELEQSARRFLGTLTAEHWMHLDQAVGELVLAPRGGLLKLCLDSGDLIRYFIAPLLNQAISSLSRQLPITDVAQVGEGAAGLADRILSYHALAAPALPKELPNRPNVGSGMRRTALVGKGGGDVGAEQRGGAKKPNAAGEQQSFLLIPASESGKAFGEEAGKVLPQVHLVGVAGQADLMCCRELAALA